MPVSIPAPRRIALLGLLLVSLVVLAEAVTRVELAHAVSDAWTDSARVVAQVAATDD